MIRIGQVGKLVSGDEEGNFVKINEFPGSPPSYLILLAHDQGFTCGCGDYWVEDFASLEQFFADGEWLANWDVEAT